MSDVKMQTEGLSECDDSHLSIKCRKMKQRSSSSILGMVAGGAAAGAVFGGIYAAVKLLTRGNK